MEKAKKVSLVALIASFLVFLVVFWTTRNKESFQTSAFLDRWLPLIVGSLVGASIILGSLYLYVNKRLKPEYKTYPLYGASALLEGIGAFSEGLYQVLFTTLGFLMIIIAVTIDVRKKTGLYRHLFGKGKD